MKYKYQPKGTCSREFIADIDNDVIKHMEIIGGCPGNTQGICRLLEGQTIDFAISKLKGIDCRGKGTSCPDQIAQFLQSIKK